MIHSKKIILIWYLLQFFFSERITNPSGFFQADFQNRLEVKQEHVKYLHTREGFWNETYFILTKLNSY